VRILQGERRRHASLGPERLESLFVLVEQPRLDDAVVLDPKEEQVGLLEDAISARPFRGSEGGGVHVAREDIDELGVERPLGQVREFLEIPKNLCVAPVVSRNRARSGYVPNGVLRDQFAQRSGILRIKRRVEALDERRVWVLEHPHAFTSDRTAPGSSSSSKPSPITFGRTFSITSSSLP